MLTTVIGPMAILLFTGLDKIYQWSSMAHQLQFVAGFLVLFGASIVLWAKKTNKFYAETVRIQYERYHAVITDGPYRYVRHPGYLGYMILCISAPLMLGSLTALFPSTLTVLGYLARTIIEDVSLQRQFKGYYDYTKKVPFRLFPGIW
jgi:protein-S-isoprenylcysteine O-methyltransferase Ste14